MPIYEYRCASCSFQHEYLQRVSDPLLTDCPECGKPTFNKMVTAAGFQLKGSGWYATDFKNNGAQPKANRDKSAEKNAGDSAEKSAEKGAEKGEKGADKTTEKAADKPADPKKDESKSQSKSEPTTSASPAGS